MANVKITDLTVYADPLNTDVLPIVDVTNNVTKQVSIANLAKNVSLGTAALPGVAFDGFPSTGVYSPGANQVGIATNGISRLIVDASGNTNIAYPLICASLQVNASVSFLLRNALVEVTAILAAEQENAQIRNAGAFSVGSPGVVPFGIGPVPPPGAAFTGIGPDAYNPIHLPSGSFC